jgi:hypothetical protein
MADTRERWTHGRPERSTGERVSEGSGLVGLPPGLRRCAWISCRLSNLAYSPAKPNVGVEVPRRDWVVGRCVWVFGASPVNLLKMVKSKIEFFFFIGVQPKMVKGIFISIY